MVQATGTGVGFWEGLALGLAIWGLFRIGNAISRGADALERAADELMGLRKLAEEVDDE